MGLSSEIQNFLNLFDLEDVLSAQEKTNIAGTAERRFPISLRLMKCYDEPGRSHTSQDQWHSAEKQYDELFGTYLSDENYYLFISGRPKNFLYKMNKYLISKIIAHEKFFYSFSIFSIDISDYMMSADPEQIIGNGQFSKMIDYINENY